VCNGKAFPKLNVERRPYRLRFLNGCNARFLELRLSNGMPFLQIGHDDDLLPRAIEQRTLLLGNANRADVVVDFSKISGDVVYLENILLQTDGRGPKGKPDRREVKIPGVPIIKLILSGSPRPEPRLARVGDLLQPNTLILPGEIVRTREFIFNRSKGAWTVNGKLFDPRRSDAIVKAGSAERWIITNKSGGWWHPIHMHLENHQIQTINARRLTPLEPILPDTTHQRPNPPPPLGPAPALQPRNQILRISRRAGGRRLRRSDGPRIPVVGRDHDRRKPHQAIAPRLARPQREGRAAPRQLQDRPQ
jgi:FtsP/CotA-like multicopper oxidase with cupredoxin domain